jgi:hypothetical protein
MPGHGSFHPVAWCQYYDGGKVWATTLGHDAGAFANDDAAFPGSIAFRKMVVGGLKSVMGIEPFCRWEPYPGGMGPAWRPWRCLNVRFWRKADRDQAQFGARCARLGSPQQAAP